MNETLKALPSGNVIDIANPDSYKFEVGEIARLLSNIRRFNGASEVTVCQHSILVAMVAYHLTGNPYIALHSLLHDSAEAFVGDIGTPVKRALGEHWDVMETKVLDAICEQLIPQHSLALHATQFIKMIDTHLLGVELEEMIAQGTFHHNDIWDSSLELTPMRVYIRDVVKRLQGVTNSELRDLDIVFALLYSYYKGVILNYEAEGVLANGFTEVALQGEMRGLSLMIYNDKLKTFKEFSNECIK